MILLGALLVALALTAGVAVFLGATEGGTRFLAGQAERFLPLRLTGVSGALLREIRVEKLEYDADGRQFAIDGLAASVALMPLLFENHLIVHSVTADAVVVTGEGSAGPAPPLVLPFLPLRVDVEWARVGRLELPGLFPMQVDGAASWNSNGLTLHGLNVLSDVIVGNVRGRLGTGADPTIQAEVNWSLPDHAWGGEGRIDGRVNSFAVHHVLRGYVSVDADGRGDLSNLAEPFVDAHVTAEDLVFGTTAVRRIGGRLHGTLANLTAELTSRVSAPGIEPFRMDVVAYGPAAGPLTVRNVNANALGGREEAQGSVAWDEDVRVTLGGTATDVSLAGLREGIIGRVSGGFHLQYRNGLLSLGLDNLSGTLNQRPVSGTVMVAQLSEGWKFDPVRLTLGGNRLSGSAQLAGSAMDLQAQIDAPALETLALGVTGDVSGSVALSGTWPRLNGTVNVKSRHLEAFDTELTSSALQAQLDRGVIDGHAAVAAARRQRLDVTELGLAARGPLGRLSWRLTWAGGESSGTLQQQNDGRELSVASLGMELLGEHWSLSRPTRVRLQGQRLAMEPACFVGGASARVCLDTFVYDDGGIDTAGTLEQAPLALFRPWLPIDLGRSGYLEGHWSLAGTPNALDGEVALAARQLRYVAAVAGEPVALPDLEADGILAKGALRVRLAATDKDFSVIGNARLEPVDSVGRLSGTVNVSATDLTPLKAFDQRIADVAGSVQGALTLSGTPAEPRLEGHFAMAGGKFSLTDPDFTLTEMELQLGLDDSGAFQLQGTAQQKDSELRLSATGQGLFSDALAFTANLESEKVRLSHPDWEVTVVPALALDYAEGRGRLHGRVVLPRAEVRLSALPTSVPSPSEDVVVVGRQSNGNGATNPWRADVEVVLGNDVTLKALGLTAKLEGALQARLDAHGRTTLRGTLNVTGGELTTQGQTLTIESGSVIYNGPVNRPYIDVRAARTIDTVTPAVKVGLHISGNANNLSSSVYSEPAMSETRALGFLVLGRDIEQQSSGDDSSRMMAAAINLGLSRSKGIASELMQVTGLDELSASAEAGNSFDIVAGKRIYRGLYVRYTYNTLSAVGAFLVRYTLTRHWQLEAHSGEQSAMDLLYSIDK